MLVKIIQIILFQALFLFVYDVWLRKETFYSINRYYLLGTSFLAIILPFISIDVASTSVIGTQLVALSEVMINPQSIQLPEVILSTSSGVSELSYIFWVYSFGMLLSALFFLRKLFRLVRLIHTNKHQKGQGFILVELQETTKVFSFLNYVFIGKEIKDTDYLINHEKVHIKQMHSIDLLWFELLRILFWFNPLIYLYQQRITALHEFIADAESIKLSDANTYYNHILNDIFQVENMAFVNQFYTKSLLKKRITMMTKNQSQQWKQIKYLILIPITALMLFITTNIIAQENDSIINNNSTKNAISQDTIPEKKEAFKQLIEFIEKHDSPNKDIMSKEEYIEFNKLVAKAVADSLVNKVNNRTYEDYVAVRINPKSIAESKEMEGAVPFSTIDEVPIYPGCENILDKAEQRKCLSEGIQKHVASKFNIDLAQNLDLSSGKKRIFVMFKIDEEGNINSIQARAPHKDLEVEAVRVIQTLPQMIAPGKQDGNAVGVKYSLPITFIVQKDTETKIVTEVKQNNLAIESEDIPFSLIDEVPIYPGCEDKLSNKEKRKCLSESIQKQVAKKFKVKKAQNLGLSPGKKRIFVMFKIDKQGIVTDIQARAPHKKLEKEAIRVIKTLPQMIASGKQHGKAVGVKYSLPITFIVQENTKKKE